MQSPMVVEVYREQLAAILDWHRHEVPGFQWGVALHRRNERGHMRFGAVTLGGESCLLTADLLDELGRQPVRHRWSRHRQSPRRRHVSSIRKDARRQREKHHLRGIVLRR